MPFAETKLGQILHADASDVLRSLDSRSVDLIMTSPPFGLLKEKEYGNVSSEAYIQWFAPFATDMKRILKNSGSLVLDIGGTWNSGHPTRSLYHYKLLISLCEHYGFRLAQEFFWWNPSKLPSPAQWVTVQKVRVKDSVNCIWWLSAGKHPKANNQRVLQPYSAATRAASKKFRMGGRRPSGHKVSHDFNLDSGFSIPPNILAVANTSSNCHYLRACREKAIRPHPARFPAQIPEFFVRMLTDPGDFVIDPFAGSCTTGEVCEILQRRWLCIDTEQDYLRGGRERFVNMRARLGGGNTTNPQQPSFYSLPRLGSGWQESPESIGPH